MISTALGRALALPRCVHYALAIVITLFTLYIRYLLGLEFLSRPLLILFVPPIIISAMVGGLRPGLISTVLSAAGLYTFFIPKTGHFFRVADHDFAQLCILILSGVLISFLADELMNIIKIQGSESLAIRQSEERYRTTLHTSMDGFILVGRDGGLLDVNQTYCDMTGYSREEVLSKNISDFETVERMHDTYAHMRKIVNLGQDRFISRHRRKDGSEFDVEISVQYRSAGGHFVAFLRDITISQRAELDLKASTDRLKIIAENTYDWEYWRGPSGGYLWVSPSCLLISGYSPEQFMEPIGKRMQDIIHPDDRNTWENHLTEVEMTASSHSDLNFRICTAEGKTIWIGHTCKPIYGSGGELLGRRGCNRDITDHKKAEFALIDSMEKYRMLFDQSPLGIFHYDQAGIILELNENFADIIGVSRKNLIGFSMLEKLQNNDLVQALRDSLDGRQSEYYGPYVSVLGKKKTYVRVLFKNIVGTDGKRQGGLALVEDVTLRMEAEQAQHESESRFRAITESAQDAIMMMDPEGKIAFWNPASERIFGYSREEAMGQNLHELLAPSKYISSYREALLIFLKTGLGEVIGKTLELTAFRKGGEEFPVSLSLSALEERGRWYAVGILRDITDRKKAETALLESQGQLQAIADSVPALVAQIDASERYVFVNTAYEEWYGTSKEQVVGSTVRDVLGAERYVMVEDSIRRVLNGERHIRQFRFELPDGKYRYGQGHYIPIFSEGNEVTGYYLMGQDITDLKLLEKDILNAKDLAEAANKAKSEFLANMSHEIRTPLNGILGMLQLLESTNIDTEQKEYIGAAKKSSTRLTRLLADILDLSKIEAGKMVLEEAEFSFVDLKESTLGLFELSVKEKGLKLEFIIDALLPARLVGDQVRLQQILFNLVGNAIKFTETGEVGVEVYRLPYAASDKERVLFVISDTGIGISQDMLAQVFDPFTQAEGSYTRRYQGAGLGLSIVRKLVNMLDGEIAIDNTEGNGTTLYISLPFKLHLSRQEQGESLAPLSHDPAETPIRILFAEDDETSLMSGKRMLEKSGYSVITAGDGQETLKLLNEHDFDLILMDIQMPVMDGMEVTERIRAGQAGEPNKSTPIIAMTAYAMVGDREKFLAAGMNDYISKPVDLGNLKEVINRILIQ